MLVVKNTGCQTLQRSLHHRKLNHELFSRSVFQVNVVRGTLFKKKMIAQIKSVLWTRISLKWFNEPVAQHRHSKTIIHCV